jgi:hypothetical protein
MLLSEGTWTGRGRYLHHGQSLGTLVELAFNVVSDVHGNHCEGTLKIDGMGEHTLAIHIVPDDTGLYDVTLSGGFADLRGTAKLESEPNMGMLWNDTGAVASFALFSTPRGCGCRGFWRFGERFLTWEIALQRLRQTSRGANVVSLRPRR